MFDPAVKTAVPQGVYADIQEFVQRMKNENVDTKQLGLVGRTKEEILEELKDMYGKEFDGYLFEDAMEETDKLLEGKVAVREEEIEVNRDMNERRR